MSNLCNIHCFNHRKANQAHNQYPDGVNDILDIQRHSNVFAERVREDFRTTKKRATTISDRRTTTKAPPAEKHTSCLEPANDPMHRLSSDNASSTHSVTTVAGDKTKIKDRASMRRSRSVYFELEEESEYTRGPIRIVSASDGVNDNCAALLLNMRFSDSIKTAIETQRELNGEIREAQKQDEKTRISLEQIEERLERYHSRQVDLVRGATGVNSEGCIGDGVPKDQQEDS
jgi:hypothetical protein